MLDDLAAALRPRLAGETAVVFCSHMVDAPSWRSLLRTAGAAAEMVLAFDEPELVDLVPDTATRSAAELVAARHELLATLAADSPLSRLLDRFDQDRRGWLVVTDPLDPPVLGSRRHLGRKHPSWALFEYKSTVDTLWDTIGLDRAESVVFDRPGRLLHGGGEFAIDDVVASSQVRCGTPSAGGGDVRRRTDGRAHTVDGDRLRVRIMPALEGTPCRVHGLVLPEATLAFPPMEVLAPHRVDDGGYLCAGTWPLSEPARSEMETLTRWLGDRLRDRLAYRGGFAVDGIVTTDGFRPTDLNTRITSAFEALATSARVAAHAMAIISRADLSGIDRVAWEPWFGGAFDHPDHLLLRVPSPRADQTAALAVRWIGYELEPAMGRDRHGVVEVTPGARGTLVSIRLDRSHLPPGLTLQLVTIAALGAADRLLGTNIGPLQPPRARRTGPA